MEGETTPWRDHAQGNPCKGVERNQEQAKERFFSEAELAALSDALAAYGSRPAGDCIRLLMLTGARPGEAMAATWKQFDAEPGFWVKPSSHTKQRKTHKAPLGPAAVELIERLRAERDASPRTKDSSYVFPGQVRGAPLRHLHKVWKEIADVATVNLYANSTDDKIAGLVADLEKGLAAARRSAKSAPSLNNSSSSFPSACRMRALMTCATVLRASAPAADFRFKSLANCSDTRRRGRHSDMRTLATMHCAKPHRRSRRRSPVPAIAAPISSRLTK